MRKITNLVIILSVMAVIPPKKPVQFTRTYQVLKEVEANPYAFEPETFKTVRSNLQEKIKRYTNLSGKPVKVQD